MDRFNLQEVKQISLRYDIDPVKLLKWAIAQDDCPYLIKNRRKVRYAKKDDYRVRYNGLIKRCKKKNFKLSLTFEDYLELVKDKTCFYCHERISSGVGLDRLRNKAGYTYDNVVPCCGRCNRLRGNLLTVKEMILVFELILAKRR